MVTYTVNKKLKTALLTIILISGFFSGVAQTATDWNDSNIFMDWSKAGADTTIKAKFTKTYYVNRCGILADNKTDNATKLRKLLAKAKPYSIIYFPAGTYFFGSSIDIPSNVTIRGAGPRKTKFNFKTLKLGQRGVFNMASYDRLDQTKLTKAAKVGETTIHVENVANYKKGDIIEIMMENDSALMYTQERWNTSWAAVARGQIIEVEKVNTLENSITVSEAIRLNYPLNDSPYIHRQNGFFNIGFEDFSLENTQEEDLVTFYFRAGRNCWINNVESINTVKHHVLFEASSKCSVTNSYMTGSFRVDGGGHGYGVTCSNHTSDCLTENNIFSGLRHAIMTKKGANGNVFVHNYCMDGRWDRQEKGRVPATISIHGHYSYLNLFEGNIVERITSGDFWGPSGPTTFINNIITSDIIEVRDKSISQVLINNVLVTGKIKISDEAIKTIQSGNQEGLAKEGAIEGQPTSLYFKNKPAYFGDLDWPITTDYSPKKIVLPAQIRYTSLYK